MAGNVLAGYASQVTLTVTNLHLLASSQDWTAGWGSVSYSNLVNLYLNFLYGFTFTTHASNRQAGVINIFAIPSLNDTPTYPAVATGTLGTEGAIAFTDTEERDSICTLLHSITVDNTASAIYVRGQCGIAQLFGDLPSHHCLFIAQNCSTTTTAGLAASGSAVYQKPFYNTYT